MENLELARKYFAQALRLNNRNMRALFGLYMVSSALLKRMKQYKERKGKKKNRTILVTLWFVKVKVGHSES